MTKQYAGDLIMLPSIVTISTSFPVTLYRQRIMSNSIYMCIMTAVSVLRNGWHWKTQSGNWSSCRTVELCHNIMVYLHISLVNKEGLAEDEAPVFPQLGRLTWVALPCPVKGTLLWRERMDRWPLSSKSADSLSRHTQGRFWATLSLSCWGQSFSLKINASQVSSHYSYKNCSSYRGRRDSREACFVQGR